MRSWGIPFAGCGSRAVINQITNIRLGASVGGLFPGLFDSTQCCTCNRSLLKKTAPVRARVVQCGGFASPGKNISDACAQRYLTTSRKTKQINFHLWAASVGGLFHFEPVVRCRRLAQSGRALLHCKCPILTHNGHWLCTVAMVLMPVSAPIKV